MSKNYDGWGIRNSWTNRVSLPVYRTKRDLIRAYDDICPGLWKNRRKKGILKAVKVRLVEAED